MTTPDAAAILQSALICQAEAGFSRASELRRQNLRIIDTRHDERNRRLAGIRLQAADEWRRGRGQAAEAGFHPATSTPLLTPIQERNEKCGIV